LSFIVAESAMKLAQSGIYAREAIGERTRLAPTAAQARETKLRPHGCEGLSQQYHDEMINRAKDLRPH
jgi:hypothetical protein